MNEEQCKKFKISICSNYDAGQSKDYNNSKVAKGWEIKEWCWNEEDVKTLSLQHGISGNEWDKGHKIVDNWKATHAIMLDFDDGKMTVEQLLKEQQLWKFNSYVFSSQNHQREKISRKGKVEPPCDRLRVLIPLDKPIKNEFDREIVQKVFIKKHNDDIDKSFMKRARYFAHGTDEVANIIDDKGFLDWKSLIKEFHEEIQKPENNTTKQKSNNGLNTFSLDDTVLDENRNSLIIKNVAPDTHLYCPVCGDEEYRTNQTHNAVLKLNPKGLPIIFCSSCESRGMGVGGKGVYNLSKNDSFKLKSEKNNTILFLDNITSKYHGGRFEKGINRFMVRPISSLDKVEQFCKNFDLPKPEVIPILRYELEFSSDVIIDYANERVNKYVAPGVLIKPIPKDYKAKLPEYAELLIDHVLGHDKKIIEHFYNDMANFIQTREKMITSYLLQGTEGTGKGLMFTHIFQNIFGEQYCTTTDQDAFGNQFNSFLTDNVFVLVDEVKGDYAKSGGKNVSVIDKIKKAITDSFLQLEGKGKDRVNGKNNCSFLFATNYRHGIALSKGDRRFNVAPRQEVKVHNAKWWPGYNELKHELHEELQEFVWYMKQYPVKKDKIGMVIDNEPKRKLQAMSTSNAEDFFNAVLAGDVSWFINNLEHNSETEKDLHEFNIVNTIINSLPERKGIRMQELRKSYNFLTNKTLPAPSFKKLARGYLPEPKTIRDGQETYHGIAVNWKMLEKC